MNNKLFEKAYHECYQEHPFEQIFREATEHPHNFDGLLIKKEFETIDEISINFLNGCKFAFEFERELNSALLQGAEQHVSREEIIENYEQQLDYIRRLNQSLLEKFRNGEDQWTNPSSKSRVIQTIKDIRADVNTAEKIKTTSSKTQLELDKFIRNLKSKNLISDNELL